MGKQKDFSFTKGFSFLFEDEGRKIDAWYSAATGLEKVYVDGRLISTQRNLSTSSSNTFRIGHNDYSTNLKVENILKGPFVCTLSKNGKVYKRKNLVIQKVKPESSKRSKLITFLFAILLGGGFGAVIAYWQLPKESLYIFVAVLFLVVFFYNLCTTKYASIVIEDEEIV